MVTVALTAWRVPQGEVAYPEERDGQLLLTGTADQIEAAAEQTEAADERSSAQHAEVSLASCTPGGA